MEELKNIPLEDDTLNYFRISIIGAKNVGKTTFLHNFLLTEKLNENNNGKDREQNSKLLSFNSTKEIQLYSKKITLYKNDKLNSEGKYISINLLIDDTPGYYVITNKNKFISLAKKNDINRQNSLIKNSLCLTRGIILMYSIDNKESYDTILDILQFLKRFKNFKQKYIVIIGNKIDINGNQRQISYEKALKLSEKNNFLFYEISSVNDLSCGHKIFSDLICKVFSLQIKNDKIIYKPINSFSKEKNRKKINSKDDSIEIDLNKYKNNTNNKSKENSIIKNNKYKSYSQKKNVNILNNKDRYENYESKEYDKDEISKNNNNINNNKNIINIKLFNNNNSNNKLNEEKYFKKENSEKKDLSNNISIKEKDFNKKLKNENSFDNNEKKLLEEKEKSRINEILLETQKHIRNNSAINLNLRNKSKNHIYFERKQVKNNNQN